APERYPFHLDLPSGAGLRESSTGLEVTQDSKRIALIGTPSATDAQGTPVDTKLEVTGPDSFDLVVSHQGPDLAYPLLVDPALDETFNDAQSTPPGWQTIEAEPNGGASFTAGISGGPSLWAIPGEAYGANTVKYWEYTPPGSTTYIPSALFRAG